MDDEYDPKSHARQDDPDTSKEAAGLLKPEAMWWKILEFLREHDRLGGWAAFEIAHHVPGLGVSPWRRVTDVVQHGWAEIVPGQRRPNPKTDRSQQTVRITQAGIRRLNGEPDPEPPPLPPSYRYLVRWEIDVELDKPSYRRAAEEAWQLRNGPDSQANTFDVMDARTGRIKTIDLMEGSDAEKAEPGPGTGHGEPEHPSTSGPDEAG